MISTRDKGFTLEHKARCQSGVRQQEVTEGSSKHTHLCSNSLMKFSYSCRHKDTNSQAKRIFQFSSKTHFHCAPFSQQSRGHPIGMRALYRTQSQNLLISANSVPAASSCLPGEVQDSPHPAAPALGWPLLCNRHRTKAFPVLLAHIPERL